jgi:uncharacterized protein (TIRG00374 family)
MNNSPQPVKHKSTLWRNFAFIFGAAALGFMIYAIGLDAILDNIAKTGWWFAAIIGVWGVTYLLNTMSWYAIIRSNTSAHVPFASLYRLTVAGYALNYVTPFGLAGGEPYRIMELRRFMPTVDATASVILYVMMHVCSHFFFWLTGMVLIACFVPMSAVLQSALIISVGACLLLIFLFFRGYRKGVVMKLTRLGEKVPFVGKKLRAMSPEARERLELIDAQIKNLHGERKRMFYTSLGLEFGSRLVSCVEIWLIIIALGYTASYVDAFIVVALSSLFANILFFSPMQLGTREGGICLAFKTIGLAPGLGVSVSLVTRIREMFWILCGVLLMKVGIHAEERRLQEKQL